MEVPSSNLRDQWRGVFYEGAAFPALARVLLTGNLPNSSVFDLRILWERFQFI